MNELISSPVDEQVLVKLYMELTGRSESSARCVVTCVESASELANSTVHPAPKRGDEPQYSA